MSKLPKKERRKVGKQIRQKRKLFMRKFRGWCY